jgi:hypothetical protein
MQRLLALGLSSVVALQLGASQPASVYDFSLNRIDGSKESLEAAPGQGGSDQDARKAAIEAAKQRAATKKAALAKTEETDGL